MKIVSARTNIGLILTVVGLILISVANVPRFQLAILEVKSFTPREVIYSYGWDYVATIDTGLYIDKFWYWIKIPEIDYSGGYWKKGGNDVKLFVYMKERTTLENTTVNIKIYGPEGITNLIFEKTFTVEIEPSLPEGVPPIEIISYPSEIQVELKRDHLYQGFSEEIPIKIKNNAKNYQFIGSMSVKSLDTHFGIASVYCFGYYGEFGYISPNQEALLLPVFKFMYTLMPKTDRLGYVLTVDGGRTYQTPQEIITASFSPPPPSPPPTYTLTINSDPISVPVTIQDMKTKNELFSGETPVEFITIPGYYIVNVPKLTEDELYNFANWEGIYPRQRLVELKSDKTITAYYQKIEVIVPPEPKKYKLTIESEPIPVSVTIDDKVVGNTTVTLELIEGKHVIKLPWYVQDYAYKFTEWDNGRILPSRIVNLLSNMTIKATYKYTIVTPEPEPPEEPPSIPPDQPQPPPTQPPPLPPSLKAEVSLVKMLLIPGILLTAVGLITMMKRKKIRGLFK